MKGYVAQLNTLHIMRHREFTKLKREGRVGGYRSALGMGDHGFSFSELHTNPVFQVTLWP